MNKTKKNLIITAISLGVIVIDVVLLFVLVIPAIRINSFFKTAEKGKEKETRRIYRSLSSSGKDKAEDLIEDFATYECNRMIKGEIDYSEMSDTFKAIENADEDFDIYLEDAYAKAASCRLVQIYEDVSQELYKNGLTDLFYELYGEFDDIYYDNDNYEAGTVDQALYDYLNDKYSLFKEGIMEYEELDAYADAGYDLFSYDTDAYNLAYDISNELYYYDTYSDDYDEAMAYYDDGEYMDCYDYCEDELYWYFGDDDDGTGFKEKFNDLMNDAYETGKTAYPEQIEELAASDKSAARELLAEVNEFYGDDIDTSSVADLCYEKWQNAYVEYIEDLDANLAADMAAGVNVGNYNDSTAISYEDNKPSYICLNDFDENGVPELVISSYDIDYVLTYNGTKVILTGCIDIYALADDARVVNNPVTISENWEYNRELIKFDGTSWTVEKCAYESYTNDKYIVDGSYVDYDEADDVYYEIQDYNNGDYVSQEYISSYEEYIYGYTD